MSGWEFLGRIVASLVVFATFIVAASILPEDFTLRGLLNLLMLIVALLCGLYWAWNDDSGKS